MIQLTPQPRAKSVTINVFDRLADILRPEPYECPVTIGDRSLLDLSADELNKIDDWQNKNRGFKDEDEEYIESFFNWED